MFGFGIILIIGSIVAYVFVCIYEKNSKPNDERSNYHIPTQKPSGTRRNVVESSCRRTYTNMAAGAPSWEEEYDSFLKKEQGLRKEYDSSTGTSEDIWTSTARAVKEPAETSGYKNNGKTGKGRRTVI